jgi:uncharacterized membrane protein
MGNPVEEIRLALESRQTKEEIFKELLDQGLKVDEIIRSYEVAEHQANKDDTSKRTIQIIVTIGAVLIGAGVFSFIAANWTEMGKINKMAIILVFMVLAYGLGWYLKEKSQLQKTGGALILLGSLIYGGGIFLVAQMFNIRANWPDGFILWMIGSIAMAFAIEAYPLFYLAIGLGIIGLVGHPWGIVNGFGSSPLLLTSSFMLLVATVVTFVTGVINYRRIPKEDKDVA